MEVSYSQKSFLFISDHTYKKRQAYNILEEELRIESKSRQNDK